MHHFILDTPRLTLRPLSQDDADAAFVWCSDPEVNRYMPYALYTHVEDVRRWLASVEAATGEYNFGFVRKSDGLLIGSGSIGPDGVSSCWEFGYNFRRDCWGQGYATEAAQAMIDFAFREFGVRDFVANHAIANPASGRVMRKCGLVIDHVGEYSRFDGSETFPALFWRLRLNRSGQAPRYSFVPMTPAQFDTYFSWRYPAPYELCNIPPEAYDECREVYDAAPENWFAVLDNDGRMTGMAKFIFSGTAMELGLGLQPESTGLGSGEQFVRACIEFGRSRYEWFGKPILLRAAVANVRAQKVYERIGFRAIYSEQLSFRNKSACYVRMVRDD